MPNTLYISETVFSFNYNCYYKLNIELRRTKWTIGLWARRKALTLLRTTRHTSNLGVLYKANCFYVGN